MYKALHELYINNEVVRVFATSDYVEFIMDYHKNNGDRVTLIY